MEAKGTGKPLEELTLLDRFLFAEAMEVPENMQILLEIILGRDIVLKFPPQTEREERRSPLSRFVRLDVWARDEEDAVYDTEVQKANAKNLPKRSRYYQGMIDSQLLEPGEVDFNRLSPVFIIVIAPFDLFGRGLYRYTFCNSCREVPGLELEDEAVRIFLNTHGTSEEGADRELVELLQYMEHTNRAGQEFNSDRLKRLQASVRSIQHNAEVGVRYMQEWEERILEQQAAQREGWTKGRAEGIAEGKAEGIALSVLELLGELGEVPSEWKDRISAEKDPDVLRAWLKKAARAESIAQFTEGADACLLPRG